MFQYFLGTVKPVSKTLDHNSDFKEIPAKMSAMDRNCDRPFSWLVLDDLELHMVEFHCFRLFTILNKLIIILWALILKEFCGAGGKVSGARPSPRAVVNESLSWPIYRSAV